MYILNLQPFCCCEAALHGFLPNFIIRDVCVCVSQMLHTVTHIFATA